MVIYYMLAHNITATAGNRKILKGLKLNGGFSNVLDEVEYILLY